MDRSQVYRIMLLGLLPLVALIIYSRGQVYDPALINFSSSLPGKESMTAFFPTEIGRAALAGRIRSYTKDNLHEYINGHAEYFISAGFNKLAAGEYSINSESSDADVLVDIYDMGKSVQAFGILSDESGGSLSDVLPGIRGFRRPGVISFSKGLYYIKITSYSEGLSLDRFAEAIEGNIAGGSDPFPEFSRLPDLGNIVTTRFIKEAYRGLDFVNNVMEREYDIEGRSVHVFAVHTGDGKLKNQFLQYFRTSDIPFQKEERSGSEVYRIKDRYEGDWVLISFHDTLFGIFGAFDDTIVNSLLAERPGENQK